MIETATIISTIVISVLLFGAVEAWSFAIAGIGAIVGFNVWLRRKELDFGMPWERWQKLMAVSVAGFLAVCAFQLIPLPAFFIKTLSPSTYSLIHDITAREFFSISLYPYETLNGVFRVAVYLMVFAMAASLSKDREAVRKIMVALVVFGFALSVFAIIQKATWNGKIYWFRELTQGGSPFGPFVNRNHFAGFVGMVIPLGIGIVLEKRHTEKTLLLSFLTIIAAVGLFFSLARGGILSFLASAAFFSALTVIRGIGKKSVFYVSLFILAVGIYIFYLGISPIIERFAQDGLTSEGRFLVWGGTLRAFADFPALGTGLDSFRYVFPMYYPQGLQRVFLFAHNDYLQLMLEMGVAGTAFAAMFLVSIAAGVVKYSRRRGMSPVLAGLCASAFYMLVHSIYDFNLHIPSNAIAFSAISGLIVAYIRGDDRREA